jgi:hypothetical protein
MHFTAGFVLDNAIDSVLSRPLAKRARVVRHQLLRGLWKLLRKVRCPAFATCRSFQRLKLPAAWLRSTA